MEWVNVLLISMLPFSELRGAIPYAALLKINPLEAYLTAVIGNFIPIPAIIFVLYKAEPLILRIPLVNSAYLFFVRRVMKKREVVEKYGYLGLALFVAIPLPVTGAWSGSLLAFLMRLDKLRSLIFIFLGILISGFIVLSLTYGILNFSSINFK